MDVSKMLVELREEHAAMGEIIGSLERYARRFGVAGRKGRPPKWMAPRRGRPLGSKNKAKAQTANA
jgi:hypothetical protein